MKTKAFDKKFDNGEEIIRKLELAKAHRLGHISKRVNVDFLEWMIQMPEKEARKLGITRKSVVE